MYSNFYHFPFSDRYDEGIQCPECDRYFDTLREFSLHYCNRFYDECEEYDCEN